MSGHRKQRGDDQLRSRKRNRVWRDRMEAARTTEAQLAIAVDWFRSSTHNFPDPDEAVRAMDEATRWLSDAADALDRRVIAAAVPYRRAEVYPTRRTPR